MNNDLVIREVKVTYTPSKSELYPIKNPDDAFKFASSMYSQETIGIYEEFMVLLLNRANKVIGCFKASKGGITGTVVDVRIIFATALKALATAMVVVHNHPSNNLTPSKEDLSLTTKLKEAGDILDISVMDHLILGTNNNYVSFSQEGWL
jgi:DNA repair protein RadC